MPSSYSRSPFLSLRPDQECGRSKSSQSTGKSFSSLSGAATPSANGHTNGVNGRSQHVNGDDEFLKLDAPQQDLLLLHGPRQKYKLEGSKDLPELQGDREILVQVLAIGLNPTDWKGADYGYGQPSYPWVNGRDFAGIVVRTARSSSRVKQGDVVFGASTDYRDIRKAAYQEYVVANDYNVTRIPQGVSVKEGAALGVAYVAALVSLGISFGLDLTRLRHAPAGPDLVGLARSLDPRKVPEDIREEIFSGISTAERPQPGEWIAIWGANSMTGRIALQLAKHAGLKVACVGDIARGGAQLSELGADIMVDKYDEKRAVDILKAVTGGKLRFGVDCNGKDTATFLQQALSQSDNGYQSHLLGLSGMPKDVGRGVVHHKVPLKIFHEAPQVGEAMSLWLEELLVQRSLKLPDVEIAEGGLAGINDALDRMRTGKISGKRIVVPVGQESRSGVQSPSNGLLPNGIGATSSGETSDLSYADSLNYDPERVRFAYWVPNVSGGLVISKIKQRTHWDLKANIRYAKTAEQNGFEYALSQIRFMAGYGAENQHEPVSLSLAMMLATERLKVIAALLPGPWNPAVAAKMIASIDQYTEGRVCVNVVSGWFRAEFASIGQWWLDHAERYRRSREFIACLKGIWTSESFTFKGDFYQFHDYPLKPKPLNLPGRPYPEIFQGGNSDDAKDNAAAVSDYYFMNGNTLEGFQKQISDVKERAKKNGREGEVGFALNAFVICRDTEEEAIRTLQEIQGKADKEAVEGFRQQVQNAGSSTSNKSGMWANSKFEDLVQYNDGFKTKLIGTKEQIAERIVLLKSLGVNIILTAFLHYEEEIEKFGQEVIPLVRELEKQGRGKDQAYEIEQNGHIYAEKTNPEPSESEAQIPSAHPRLHDSSHSTHAYTSRGVFTQSGATHDVLASSSGLETRWAPPSWRTNPVTKSFSHLTATPPYQSLEVEGLVLDSIIPPSDGEDADCLHESLGLSHDCAQTQTTHGLGAKDDRHGNFGVQWEESPDWESVQKQYMKIRKDNDKDVEGTGQGNVGTQWEDPPNSLPDAIDVLSNYITSRQGVEGSHFADEYSHRNETGPQGGNVEVRWEKQLDRAPMAGHDDTLLAPSMERTYLQDQSRSAGVEINTHAESQDAAEQVVPEFDWDPVTETFTSRGLAVGDFGSGQTEEASETLPLLFLTPMEEPAAEKGDLAMLMGSQEGDIPDSLTWDPVNETFKQQAPECEEITEKDELGKEGLTSISIENEISVSDSGRHLVTTRHAETIDDPPSQRESDTLSLLSPARQGDSQVLLKNATEDVWRKGESDITRSDGESHHRKSLNESLRGGSFFSKIKRRVSKVKWHSDSVH